MRLSGVTRKAAIEPANSGGCTVFAILASGETRNWSVIMTPLIGSAGLVANQPTIFDFSPFWLRMFQIALHFREVLLTGPMPLPSAKGSVKPQIPCLSARFPVARDVHSIGESGGWSVAICPVAPSFTSRCRLGILPPSMSGKIIFQSAASHPISRTLREAI